MNVDVEKLLNNVLLPSSKFEKTSFPAENQLRISISCAVDNPLPGFAASCYYDSPKDPLTKL